MRVGVFIGQLLNFWSQPNFKNWYAGKLLTGKRWKVFWCQVNNRPTTVVVKIDLNENFGELLRTKENCEKGEWKRERVKGRWLPHNSSAFGRQVSKFYCICEKNSIIKLVSFDWSSWFFNVIWSSPSEEECENVNAKGNSKVGIRELFDSRGIHLKTNWQWEK